MKLNTEGYDIRKKAEKVFDLSHQPFSIHIKDREESELKENEKVSDIVDSCNEKTPLLHVRIHQPEFNFGSIFSIFRTFYYVILGILNWK